MLKYRLISAFILIPVVIAALFLLPLIGFAITTLVVCMLAAWEWGQLSGFVNRSQRVWLAVLCGLLLSLMLFTLPEYYHSTDIAVVQGSLWLSMFWWLAALVLVLLYPASAAFWRRSKGLRLAFGLMTIVPF
ncbi:phosphatidate cytidylyltransferase, partial [Atlantibacter hermannii]